MIAIIRYIKKNYNPHYQNAIRLFSLTFVPIQQNANQWIIEAKKPHPMASITTTGAQLRQSDTAHNKIICCLLKKLLCSEQKTFHSTGVQSKDFSLLFWDNEKQPIQTKNFLFKTWKKEKMRNKIFGKRYKVQKMFYCSFR